MLVMADDIAAVVGTSYTPRSDQKFKILDRRVLTCRLCERVCIMCVCVCITCVVCVCVWGVIYACVCVYVHESMPVPTP